MIFLSYFCLLSYRIFGFLLWEILNDIFLIAETTYRRADAPTGGVAEHGGVNVAEEAVVRACTASLGSTPEVGVVAEIGVTPGVGASRKRTEACGVVLAGRVAYGTGIGAAAPTRGTRQCLSYVRVVATAHILALAAHIAGELGPFRIARHVPPRGAYTLHPAGVG